MTAIAPRYRASVVFSNFESGALVLSPGGEVDQGAVTPLSPRYRASVVFDNFDGGSLLLSPGPEFELRTIMAPFIQGPPGQNGAAGGSFTYTQVSPSLLWIVNHNLGFHPVVALLSPGGLEIEASIQHTSLNQFTAAFNTPQAGSAEYK